VDRLTVLSRTGELTVTSEGEADVSIESIAGKMASLLKFLQSVISLVLDKAGHSTDVGAVSLESSYDLSASVSRSVKKSRTSFLRDVCIESRCPQAVIAPGVNFGHDAHLLRHWVRRTDAALTNHDI
jgi:hypothetical protein